MIRVVCPNCSAKYRFDESRLAGKPSVRATCQKCGGSIEISASASDEAAGEPVAAGEEPKRTRDTTTRAKVMRSDIESTMTSEAVASDLELPADRKYSLAVLQGAASGSIFPISKARTTLGRAECDIVLDDPECSREHAVIEILGSRVVLRDLKSTNGTFVDRRRVDEAELDNHTEFRVGEHVLMLIITPQE